jgi:transcriptional regulator with GAF, ATPase, and Fis domain
VTVFTPVPDISRITYLKVLTRALLRHIERLEESQADRDLAGDKNFYLKSQVQEFEAELIRSALEMTHGRQRRAARLLGTKVTTLNTKIRRYKIVVRNSDFE